MQRKGLSKWIFYTRRYWIAYLGLLLFLLLETGLMLVQPFLMKVVIDNALALRKFTVHLQYIADLRTHQLTGGI